MATGSSQLSADGWRGCPSQAPRSDGILIQTSFSEGRRWERTIRPGHGAARIKEGADEGVLPPPRLHDGDPAVQDGERDRAPTARASDPHQRRSAVARERPRLADDRSPMVEQTLLERAAVDARYGEDVDEREALPRQFRIERAEQRDRGMRAHAVGRVLARRVGDRDLAAQPGREARPRDRLDHARTADLLCQELEDIVGVVVEPLENADERWRAVDEDAAGGSGGGRASAKHDGRVDQALRAVPWRQPLERGPRRRPVATAEGEAEPRPVGIRVPVEDERAADDDVACHGPHAEGPKASQ